MRLLASYFTILYHKKIFLSMESEGFFPFLLIFFTGSIFVRKLPVKIKHCKKRFEAP